MADEIPSEYSTFYKKTTKRPKGILFVLGVVVLLLIVVFVILRFFSVDSLISSVTKQGVTPTQVIKPTATLMPTPMPSADPKITPTGVEGKGKVTPTKADSKSGLIDRSLLIVAVQNGSGEAGAARKIANVLSGLGYKLGSVGNADKFDYTGITIQVKSTKGNYLEQLKKDLSEDYTVSSATKDLPSSSTADALVIYGEDE